MRISDWSSDVCSSDLFDERQQIALHALAGNVAADPLRARGDLVDLVEEDDAVLLNRLNRLGGKLLLVEQLVARSEERRLGKECVSPCRSRGSRFHLKKKKTEYYMSFIRNHVLT